MSKVTICIAVIDLHTRKVMAIASLSVVWAVLAHIRQISEQAIIKLH